MALVALASCSSESGVSQVSGPLEIDGACVLIDAVVVHSKDIVRIVAPYEVVTNGGVTIRAGAEVTVSGELLDLADARGATGNLLDAGCYEGHQKVLVASTLEPPVGEPG